jgi:ArsR family transcriptional regulator, arsenate/arsenite/antimonite-responsive transcriptional repressor
MFELSGTEMFDVNPSPVPMERLIAQLKALANPKRLQMIHLLMEGVHCNCELGDALDMAPNLISHHMSILRDLGLVEMERDVVDSRWVYFSINEAALAELNQTFQAFFDPQRIQPRRPMCGPQGSVVTLDSINFDHV